MNVAPRCQLLARPLTNHVRPGTHLFGSKRKFVSKPPSAPTTHPLETTSKGPPTGRPPDQNTGVPYPLPKAFCIGSLAGFLGSLAGMGGGFVMIPLMTSNLLRLSQHQAHGTSLFAVATTGAAGALSYSGQVDWEAAVAITLSGMIMARVGAGVTATLSEQALKRALGVFMLVIAPLVPAKAYLGTLNTKDQPEPGDVIKPNFVRRIGPPAIIGLASGFLAGLFGVGGGAIVVPALTLCTDMSHYQALGTSLCAMTLPAIVGTTTHFSKGNVVMRIAPTLALGSFVGAYLGGKMGLQTDETTLRWGFSGLMLVLGVKTLTKT